MPENRHSRRHPKCPHAALDDLAAERGNPANRRGIASVTVYADAPALADGVELPAHPGPVPCSPETPEQLMTRWRR